MKAGALGARSVSAGIDDQFVQLYEDLHRLSSRQLGNERADHTLQETALLHEVYLKLARSPDLCPEDRKRFLARASRAIHRILIDHARSKKRRKRGGEWGRLPLEQIPFLRSDTHGEVLDLEEELEKLAAESPRQARVVELRFFGGLNFEETGAALGVTERTAREDWRYARAWLYQKLKPPKNST